MIIREELLKENSLENVRTIVEFVGDSRERVAELMECFLAPDYRLTQRAAWAVSHLATKKPELIKQYIPQLVAQLSNKNVHDAVIRNSVRILQHVEIPVDYHGDVMNACFSFIESSDTAVAIKAFSLTTLHNLAKSYPEIIQELKLIIEARWDVEGAAFRSRAKQILFAKK